MDASRTLNRRQLIASGAAGLAVAAAVPMLASGQAAGAKDLIWGANGHPITAYPGIPFEAQLDLVAALGLTQYRVNTRGDGSPEALEALLPLAQARGITILPILHPDVDLDRDPVRVLTRRAFELGRDMAARFKGRMPVWELSNELEVYAILKPCERRDDGTQYPCEWGPAGGVDPLEYYGPRWAKVSAVLSGLSKGVAAGDPAALRAMGTAGWGHLGAFERMARDRIAWDITVWHDYEGVTEEFLAKLASYGKPIWITEFNAGLEGADAAARAAELTRRMDYYRTVGARHGVTAAFVYELLDEPYWGDNFEARMGVVSMEKDGDGWRIGDLNPLGHALRAAVRAGR
jgi:sugar phosphate isomerase/epimerase